jgi:cytochrome P450
VLALPQPAVVVNGLAGYARGMLLDPAARTATAGYADLAAGAPVLDAGGLWVVSGHAAVSALAGDPRLVIDPRAADPPLPLTQSERLEAIFGEMLGFRDGAAHARLRRLVTAAFGARRLAALAGTVDAVVDELVDRALERGSMEVVADVGVPLPVAASCAVLDLPRQRWGEVTGWAQTMTAQLFTFGQSPQQLAAVEAQLDALTGYVAELAAERRGRRGDLIAELLSAAEDGDRLSREEFVAFVVLLFMNGLETVTMAVAGAVGALLWRPGLAARLRAHPDEAGAVFEEVLRLDTPLWLGARRATAELRVGEHVVRPNDPVFLLWAVANRDPAVFAEPDAFRPGRSGRHLAFGRGPHQCLGLALARLQGAAVLRRFAGRCELSTDLTPQSAPRRRSAALNGYAELPVTVRPVGAPTVARTAVRSGVPA